MHEGHDKAFMWSIVEGAVRPYMFHMCWTTNKGQKLENFKKVNMWYLDSSKCTDRNLMPPAGALYKQVLSAYSKPSTKKISEQQSHNMFNALSEECCVLEGTL